jgi:hypothetical protein
MDYDFVHSAMLYIPCNADYTAKFTPRDINVWCSRVFLGDGMVLELSTTKTWTRLSTGQMKRHTDGGCVVFALWSLGQEDLRLGGTPKKS